MNGHHMPVYKIRDFHWVVFESAINERRELSAHIIKGIHRHSNTKIDIYKTLYRSYWSSVQETLKKN